MCPNFYIFYVEMNYVHDPVRIIYVRFMLMTNHHSMRMLSVWGEIVENSSPLGYDSITFLPFYAMSSSKTRILTGWYLVLL